jgi:predicted glutamine amidotransferase
MCGIFGVISKHKENKPNAIFETLLIESDKRGKEASGFAILGQNQKALLVNKIPFSGKELLQTKVYKDIKKELVNTEFFLGIGHSRLVTNGYEQHNYNNQPIVADGKIVIHNGIIVNTDDLWKKYPNTIKKTDLDTELIPTIVNNALQNKQSYSESIRKVFNEIEGIANIALLDVQKTFMTIASNNGSLYYVFDAKTQLFLFASESIFLSKAIKSIGLSVDVNSIQQLVNSSLYFDFIKFEIITDLKVLDSDATTKFDIKEVVDTDEKQVHENKSLETDFEKVPESFLTYFDGQKKRINELKRCTKCILPSSFPFIEFDSNGVCNYCSNYKKYDTKGEVALKKLINDFQATHGRMPKVLIGLSGGRDSCYALYYVSQKLGVEAVAFSYDWGMLTDLARRNQSRMCAKLSVEHILISADIRKKRKNIKLNVEAWLKSPNLGTIPLFMAGDKHYFYHANKIMDEKGLDFIFFGENLLESTFFKYGFCGIKPNLKHKEKSFSISAFDKLKMMLFYFKQYLLNPSYINSSLLDSFGAFLSFYYIKHPYLNLFHYIEWDEKEIIDTLINQYHWETDPETNSTWRIGDGTAAFYNYIYYINAGFSEYDTFRSNEIREGRISRAEALAKVNSENSPRWNSIQWYCNTINTDWKKAIQIINNKKNLYG